MQLVNHTPVPADLTVSHIDGLPHRLGMLTAKATFRFAQGRTELDAQEPFGLFVGDEPTEHGLLPADLMLRRDKAFEVILLGAAHAPEGEEVTEQRVRLAVGNVERELAVFGDRVWDTSGAEPVISEPLPYARMPLTWGRAHGGRCEVEIDREAFIEVADPYNPLGRGFDAGALAKTYGEALVAPNGYPKLDYQRSLPNIEDPACLIHSWEDAPKPACWATVPLGLPFHQVRLVEALRQRHGTEAVVPGELGKALYGRPSDDALALAELVHRAHPDWIIDRPDAEAEVRLEGLDVASTSCFQLPALRVVADYVVGHRTGTRELLPQSLVLLPEEQRLYLVYRARFGVHYDPQVERACRLRLEPGWYPRQSQNTEPSSVSS